MPTITCPPWCDRAHDATFDDGSPMHSVTKWVGGTHDSHPIEVRVIREDFGLVLNIGGEAYLPIAEASDLVAAVREILAIVDGVNPSDPLEQLADLPVELDRIKYRIDEIGLQLQRDREASAVRPEKCPVPWCVNPGADCAGDHFADPGGPAWPGVVATAYENDGRPQVGVAPVWTECDGLSPAVLLFVESVNFSADLHPDEARRLAFELTRAAEAAESAKVDA